VKDLGALCRLLGDEARLRLLRVLTVERLNVTELTAVLGLAQSGISRHLGLLKEAGLVEESREGGYVFYAAASPNGNALRADVWTVLKNRFAETAGDAAVQADDARLKEVLRLRKEDFKTHGPESRQMVPGRSWAAWARALGHLLPPVVVADLGCGEGYLSLEAARWASRVIAIDRAPEVLKRARSLAKRRRVSNVTWRVGELEHVPLPDASVDLVLLSQALHHAAQPARALAEAARILRPGGHLLILDLRTHDQEWVTTRLGDRWLGFSDHDLKRLLRDAGFAHVRLDVGARLKGDPFTVLIASGTRQVADAHRTHSSHRLSQGDGTHGEHHTRTARATDGTADPAARRRDGHDDPAAPAHRS
jgi:SAM-dependent methyltransferase